MKFLCMGFLSLLPLLAGCVHKMDIEQGNIVSEKKIHKIHPGMSKNEVKTILGEPILTDANNKNELNYVYTSHPGRGKTTQKSITLTFEKEKLQAINKNYTA